MMMMMSWSAFQSRTTAAIPLKLYRLRVLPESAWAVPENSEWWCGHSSSVSLRLSPIVRALRGRGAPVVWSGQTLGRVWRDGARSGSFLISSSDSSGLLLPSRFFAARR